MYCELNLEREIFLSSPNRATAILMTLPKGECHLVGVWDKKQNPIKALRPYTLEEAYEVVSAIEREDLTT